MSNAATDYNAAQIETGTMSRDQMLYLLELGTYRFQSAYGLEVDGMAGPNTLAQVTARMHEATEPDDAPITDMASAALVIAIDAIGKGEDGGNNSGPFVEMLHGKVWDGDDDDDGSWCASFVSWCSEQASDVLGGKMPFKRSGGAKALYKRIGKAGRFLDDGELPQPGDVVCWDRGKPGSWQGHIGWVEGCTEGILRTIEGNVGRYPARVRRLQHDLDASPRLIGFARLPEVQR